MSCLKKGFVSSNMARAILSSCNSKLADGEEQGSQYIAGLTEVAPVVDVVTRPEVKSIARALLGFDGPLAYLSLTALTVEPNSKGMRGHIDYPHFHPSCPSDRPMVAQFVLALDGTTDGRAPTWLDDPTNTVELEAGDMFAFAGNSLHGVNPNTSNRSRTNLLWSIGPAWIRPMQMSLWNFHKIDDVSYRDLIEQARKR
jgi:hypothetical protein